MREILVQRRTRTPLRGEGRAVFKQRPEEDTGFPCATDSLRGNPSLTESDARSARYDSRAPPSMTEVTPGADLSFDLFRKLRSGRWPAPSRRGSRAPRGAPPPPGTAAPGASRCFPGTPG